VFQEKTDSTPILTDKLQKGQERMIEITKKLASKQKEYGLDLSEDEYVASLKFGLVEVVYEWARGMVCLIFLFSSSFLNLTILFLG